MKILCFGDSNTYGYDPRSFIGSQYPPRHRWVDLLAQKLGCDAVNAGENGREIPEGEGELMRFEMMLARHDPVDLLVIMLGTNDLLQGDPPEVVARRMEAFLEHIPLERSKILLIAPPPMQRGAWVPSKSLIDASTALNREYEALCARLGIGFADARTWDIPLTFDGVHFSEEGHGAFAEGLANYLTKENE